MEYDYNKQSFEKGFENQKSAKNIILVYSLIIIAVIIGRLGLSV